MTSSSRFRRRVEAGILAASVLAGVLWAFHACGEGEGRTDLKSRARAAIDRASAFLLASGEHDLGTLHVLSHLGELTGRLDFRAKVEAESGRFEKDLYRALLHRNLEPVPLMGGSKKGLQKLQWYLTHAANPDGSERAAAVVAEFLALELHGHALTHQLFAVIWRRELGLKEVVSPERIRALVDKTHGEASVLPKFSDLFAEQVGVLLWIDPSRSIPSAWIEELLDAREDDGSFHDRTSWRMTFDGESEPVRASATHTTSHAVVALEAWLKQ